MWVQHSPHQTKYQQQQKVPSFVPTKYDGSSSFDDSSSVSSAESSEHGSPNRQCARRQKQKNNKNYHPHPHQQPRYTNSALQMPPKSAYVALDCEMVGVGYGGVDSSLARVTIIDWFGNILLDQYVRQTQTVTDYRTFVSGVEPHHLEEATMTLEHCRTVVLQILQNRILVGHALENDLKSLGITHPWWLVRDTAAYEPFMQRRNGGGSALWPRKLKVLAKERLQQDVQVYGKPHSPIEDATTALNLYRSVRAVWELKIKTQMEAATQIHQQQQQQQQEQQALFYMNSGYYYQSQNQYHHHGHYHQYNHAAHKNGQAYRYPPVRVQ